MRRYYKPLSCGFVDACHAIYNVFITITIFFLGNTLNTIIIVILNNPFPPAELLGGHILLSGRAEFEFWSAYFFLINKK